MNLRIVGRCIAISLTLAVAACATAPPERASILDVMEEGASSSRPRSCAAVNAATFCEQSSRLDRAKKCGCVDRQSLTDGTPFVF
jgi:hypothetical protein